MALLYVIPYGVLVMCWIVCPSGTPTAREVWRDMWNRA